jgi:small conductance mechanosensitive channel
MEQLETTTNDVIEASAAAWDAIAALAVTYAFSFVGAIILLVVGYILAGFVERSLYMALGKFRAFDETLRRFFSKVVRYALLIVIGVAVLAQFGVQTASIIAALGAIGLAIGLALQGTLQNIAAGIMLLALRPFRVGEYIQTSDGNVAGTIEEIGLFATELKTVDGLFVMAPNSSLWNTPVTNYTRNARRMIELVIGIGYDDDIGLAQRTLIETARSDDRVLKDPEPTAFVDMLDASTVNVKLRCWTSTTNWFAAKTDLTRTTKEAIEAAGISIPFPQQEVHYIPQMEEAARGKAEPEPKRLARS